MTEQTVFNKVVRFLRQQNKKAIDQCGICQYRAPDGAKCAVGCLISDKHYNPDMEGCSLDNPDVNKARFPQYLLPHWTLLSDLQKVHDRSQVMYWEMDLADVAEKYNLKMPKSEFARATHND